jgi:hypothetical protein
MVIPPGITSSYKRNPPEEWLFHRELPAHIRGIHQKNGYSTGNYQLRHEESTRRIPAHGSCFRLARSKCVRNPPNGYNFRISNSKSCTTKVNFSKI